MLPVGKQIVGIFRVKILAESKISLSHLPRQTPGHLSPLSTQSSMPSTSFTTMTHKTRSTNADQHPGVADKKRQHCTKAEMEVVHTQEAEKKVQKELDQKVKVDRITSIEQRLTDELDVTPRPPIKQRLCPTTSYAILPLDDRMEDVTGDESSNNKFQPTSGYERETKVKIKTETDRPPKKKKVVKKLVRTAVKAAQLAVSNAIELTNGNKDTLVAGGTKGHELVAGKKNYLMATTCLMEESQLMGREIGGNVLISAFLLTMTMLTLDRTTVFYFSLMQTSDQKSQYCGLISSWAAEVSAGCAHSKASSKPGGVCSIPSLTNGTTQSTSTSVLTNRVAITSANLGVVNVSDAESGHGFPDEDETKGVEWDAAVTSPPKGKKHATSSVSVAPYKCMLLMIIIPGTYQSRKQK
jgi:hypothetical protein